MFVLQGGLLTSGLLRDATSGIRWYEDVRCSQRAAPGILAFYNKLVLDFYC